MSKFSILTACHNDYRFIKQCANSILGQSYDNMEWIVVDDCSDDGSWEYLSSIDDSRVKVMRNASRMHCSSTYDVALKNSTGDICGIVDGDDALVDNAINKIVKKYRRNPSLGYIYTQHYWCDKKLKERRRGLSSFPGKLSFAELAKKGRHCFSHWRTFRSKLASKVTLFPEGLRFAVDKNMGFVLQSIAKGGFYDEPLYRYRYYKGNMSLTNARDQKRVWMSLAQKYARKRSFPIMRVK